ncbi:MAG TPA: 50S ribosomal protein L3 [Thermodesulfobacteriota bacterium]|nr:50S ribosomal protein L3 [Thermodesulfobacteriota bacterium]
MSLGLIGRKLGVSQVFADSGEVIPVTVIEAGPCVVVQKKTQDKDGYNALQVGFLEREEKKTNRPLKGHFAKEGTKAFAVLKEFTLPDVEGYQSGQEIKVDIFSAGELVDVIGTSKGKGFAGGVKRWGFRGGPATHGSMFHRAPGSVGASAYPSRVLKGKRLPGHLGNAQVTAKNLQVVDVRSERNLILIKGAVPGARRSIVLIKKQ